MLQPAGANASTSPFPSSPAGSNFTPRKEFVQAEPRHSSFALLAFTSNNAIRLSNFPQPLVTALRTLLEAVVGLRSFRENSEHKLCELVLTGKPWSNPKHLSTEIVLVKVFAVLLAHGWSFLSQLDYGREHNDRLSLAFSRPTPTPNPNPLSPTQPKQPLLVPFAVSFPSPTTLRVVCPPLHATPAILQSVRGAWPRGVTSEKKLGEGCFEFKLKGYSWFSEDTFPEDALAHILTLLTAFDKHAWTLLTSLSLTTTRPRNKDLWIFSGPDPGSSPLREPLSSITGRASPVRLGTPLSPSKYEPIVDHTQEGSGDSEGSGDAASLDKPGHLRGATTESPTTLGRSGSKRLSKLHREGHGRAATDATDSPPAVLWKKTLASPKQASEPMPGEEQHRELQHVDHDIIPGPPPPPDVIYSTPILSPPRPPQPPALERNQTETIHVSDLPNVQQRFPSDGSPQDDAPKTPMGPPPSHPLVSLPEPAERHHSDEDFHESTPPQYDNTSTRTLQPPSGMMPQGDTPTPPLLGPTAFRSNSDDFRDSAFSDATGHSFDVPIKWIPGHDGQSGEERGERDPGPPPSAFLSSHLNADARTVTDRSSITTGPLLPGGWAPTPATEIADPTAAYGSGDTDVMPERHNTVEPRSPEIVRPELPGSDARRDSHAQGTDDEDKARRKSEAGVLGVMPSPSRENAPPVPPLPHQEQSNGHAGLAPKDGEKAKEGWVLVSVEPPAATPAQQDRAAPKPAEASGSESALSPATTHVPISAAQLIAAADATSPSGSPTPASTSASPPPEKSALGRLFSRSRSHRKGAEGGVQKVKSADKEVSDSDKEKEKEKGGRFRRKGGVLPTIRSGKRISID